MKVCIVNLLDHVHVTDIDHWPNSIICFTYLRNHLFSMVLPIYVIISLHTKKFCVFCLFYILFLWPICNVDCDDLLFFMNFVIFVLSRFRTNLLAANHFVMCQRTNFTLNRNLRNFCLKLWHSCHQQILLVLI